jgi:hypothetical protein
MKTISTHARRVERKLGRDKRLAKREKRRAEKRLLAQKITDTADQPEPSREPQGK